MNEKITSRDLSKIERFKINPSIEQLYQLKIGEIKRLTNELKKE